MFWERVLKSVFVGPETLQLGIYDAVVHFNIGCQASVKILEEIGISPGHYCKDEAPQADSVQVLKPTTKSKESTSLSGDCSVAKERKKLTNNKKRRVIFM